MQSNKERKGFLVGLIGRVAGSFCLVLMLLVFLMMMRLLDVPHTPDRMLRPVETVSSVVLPSAPPLELRAEARPPPPPPPPSQLPELEFQGKRVSPPFAANLDPRIELTMAMPDFDLEETSMIRQPSLPVDVLDVSEGELDARPRLLNKPYARYPASLLRRGVRYGTVLLEIAISPSGRVNVRRVLSSSHPGLIRMATSFASRSQFTVPRKNGRPVTAIYRWPMTLLPPGS